MRNPRLVLEDFQAMDLKSKWNKKFQCFDVETPHALSQIAGYAKYRLANDGAVYFRGQAREHGEMRPGLFRKVATSATADSRTRQLQDYIKQQVSSNNIFINNTPDYAYEPILQHYGLKTRWIDLVDNIWNALWFACHTARSVGKND